MRKPKPKPKPDPEPVPQPGGPFAVKCPVCGANFIGAEIPWEQRKYYGSQTHFLRVVAIEERDRIVAWKCPDCGHTWPRPGYSGIPVDPPRI